MQPLVSILIAAYNAENWIGEAITSATSQTWPHKEVIVVDDGSTDSTHAVASTFSSPNVRIVHQANQGASAARNKAMSLCQGDYIQWLDSDDVLAPDKIALQLRSLGHANNQGVLLSSSWGMFENCVEESRFTPNSLWCDLSPVEWLTRKMQENAWMSIESWLVDRSLVEKVGEWNTKLSADDDGEFFCRLVCTSSGIRFIKEARSYVRRSGDGSLSSGIEDSDSKMDSQFLSISTHINCLISLAANDLTKSACLRMLQGSLEWFYPRRMDIVQKAEELASSLGGGLDVPPPGWRSRQFRRTIKRGLRRLVSRS